MVWVGGDGLGWVGCLGVGALWDGEIGFGFVGGGAHIFFFSFGLSSFLAMSSVTRHLHQRGQGIRVGRAARLEWHSGLGRGRQV